MIEIKKIRDRRLWGYRFFTWMHQHRDGRTPLREESSWRLTRGFLVSTRWGSWTVMVPPKS
jgi:hypothetical protein